MKNNMGNYAIAIMGIAAIGLSSLAWTGNQQSQSIQYVQDTVPTGKKSKEASKEYKKDLDKEIDELDRATHNLRNMPHIDFNRIQAEIEASMKEVNEQLAKHKMDKVKLQKEINETLAQVDIEKIQADLKASLKDLDQLDGNKIDSEKLRNEIEKSLEEIKTRINPEEIRKSVEKAIDKVDMEKVKQEVEKATEEIKKNKVTVKLDMEMMRKEIENSRNEVKGFQEMIYEMEKEGLINTKNDYSIEYKQGEIYINGNKQSGQVNNKYRSFFKKDGVTIRKEKGEMNINIQ